MLMQARRDQFSKASLLVFLSDLHSHRSAARGSQQALTAV